MMIRATILICISFFVSGCTAFESFLEHTWLVPRKSVSVDLPGNISPEHALTVFSGVAIDHFPDYLQGGKPEVSYQGEDVIEIGHWRETNRAGYSAKAEIINKGQTLRFTIKGADFYYKDLPVKESSTGNLIRVDSPVEYTANNIAFETVKKSV